MNEGQTVMCKLKTSSLPRKIFWRGLTHVHRILLRGNYRVTTVYYNSKTNPYMASGSLFNISGARDG